SLRARQGGAAGREEYAARAGTDVSIGYSPSRGDPDVGNLRAGKPAQGRIALHARLHSGRPDDGVRHRGLRRERAESTSYAQSTIAQLESHAGGPEALRRSRHPRGPLHFPNLATLCSRSVYAQWVATANSSPLPLAFSDGYQMLIEK